MSVLSTLCLAVLPFCVSSLFDYTELQNINHPVITKEQDEILKQALALQVELERTRRELQKLGMPRHTAETSSHHPDEAFDDGSFDHFVNYRSMAEFESH